MWAAGEAQVRQVVVLGAVTLAEKCVSPLLQKRQLGWLLSVQLPALRRHQSASEMPLPTFTSPAPVAHPPAAFSSGHFPPGFVLAQTRLATASAIIFPLAVSGIQSSLPSPAVCCPSGSKHGATKAKRVCVQPDRWPPWEHGAHSAACVRVRLLPVELGCPLGLPVPQHTQEQCAAGISSGA